MHHNSMSLDALGIDSRHFQVCRRRLIAAGGEYLVFSIHWTLDNAHSPEREVREAIHRYESADGIAPSLNRRDEPYWGHQRLAQCSMLICSVPWDITRGGDRGK